MINDVGNAVRIRVDPANPGQFFACCGLLELADRLWGGAEGWFAEKHFYLRPDRELYGLLETFLASEPTPQTTVAGVPVKPLLAPLLLHLPGNAPPLALDAWLAVRVVKGTVMAIANPPWNFWSGQQTSFRIWMAMRSAFSDQIRTASRDDYQHLFDWRVPLTGRFGFDPGAAWNALDVGFSPNEQRIAVSSSPAAEMLAAVGLQRFRPTVSVDRAQFVYGIWSRPLDPSVASVPAAGIPCPMLSQRFLGKVVSRGSYSALGFSTPLERSSP